MTTVSIPRKSESLKEGTGDHPNKVEEWTQLTWGRKKKFPQKPPTATKTPENEPPTKASPAKESSSATLISLEKEKSKTIIIIHFRKRQRKNIAKKR